MLDRIDLHIEVTPVPFADLTHNRPEEDSATIRKRVVAARKIQQARFDGMPVHSNAMMGSSQLREFCPLNTESARLLETAMERLNLSARAYDRIIKVARTIADLDRSEAIRSNHIAEAIRYRSLDRASWGA